MKSDELKVVFMSFLLTEKGECKWRRVNLLLSRYTISSYPIIQLLLFVAF